MTQEEKKNLLLKDLCTRLSYGVKAKANDINVVTINGDLIPPLLIPQLIDKWNKFIKKKL